MIDGRNSLDILNNISLSLPLSLSFLFSSTRRRNEKKRGEIKKKKSILSICLDNFVTPVENGVVISQRIARSFNIVSSIVSKRSLEKAGHFWSHVSFPLPPPSFHYDVPRRRREGGGGDHSPRRRRRRSSIVCRSMPWQNRR